jgi:uncharacterized membrane protein
MEGYERGLRSQSRLGGHPIHPMLIPFPIAFLVGGLLADLAYWSTADAFWARAAAWLIGAGFVSGVAAAVFGLVDFLFIRRVRALRAAWFHFIGNGAVLLLTLWNLAIRLDGAAAPILPTGLLISAAVVVLLLFTGWYGGELAYRYKIGAVDGLPTGLEAAPRPAPSFVGEEREAASGSREAQAMADAERERQQQG